MYTQAETRVTPTVGISIHFKLFCTKLELLPSILIIIRICLFFNNRVTYKKQVQRFFLNVFVILFGKKFTNPRRSVHHESLHSRHWAYTKQFFLYIIQNSCMCVYYSTPIDLLFNILYYTILL